MYREYIPEPLNGTKVDNWQSVVTRRKYVGRKIEWHERGWSNKRTGTVDGASGMGKNVLISGDYRWAPHMINVHVLPEES